MRRADFARTRTPLVAVTTSSTTPHPAGPVRLTVAAELPGAVGVERDARDDSSAAAGVDRAWTPLDGIDMLVNHAGLGMRTVDPHVMTRPRGFWEVPVDGFRAVVETNLTGYFLVAREVVPRTLAAGGGRVVTVSVNHETMRRAGFVPYGPSRAGRESLSRIMAVELRDSGVTVNLLPPEGATATGMPPADALPREPDGPGAGVMGPRVRWLASGVAASGR
ncbi:SDR family oxidoreductase [Micromonospora maritima]|uniref:SDR family oxidoreductase n=1 Tax=Micromonospora maritima TaxID=986711 RepID=A0ABW7ZIN4_9ACTN